MDATDRLLLPLPLLLLRISRLLSRERDPDMHR